MTGGRGSGPRRPARKLAPAFVFSMGLLYVASATAMALAFLPTPHSDWALYWQTAGDLSAYERGGLGWWLLALPKALGLPPALAALVINLAAGLAVLWLAWWVDPGRHRVRVALAGIYLCLLAPYAGIVQLDLFAAAGVAAAFALSARAVVNPGRPMAWLGAAACLAVAVSTKPQYALLAWAIVLLLAWPAWRWRRSSPWAPAFVAVLLAGSLAGFAIDQGQRKLGDRDQALRTSSAVTLYAGLLVSADRNEPRAPRCGYWTPAAAAAAREDLHKPLAVAVRDRLAARPATHWLSVIGCKLPQVVRPPAFALDWLISSPSVQARLDPSTLEPRARARLLRAQRVEAWLYAATSVLMLLALATASASAWRRGWRFGALLPLAWVAAFWGVHLVFEIQGRYFLGLYLLSPLVCALALTPAAATAPGRGR